MEKPATFSKRLDGLLSIIMPAFNESEFIESNLREIVRTMDDLGHEYEIILVDDGSPDETYLYGLKAKMHHPERVRIVRYDENAGKGNALMVGTRYSSGAYIAFLDADMDLHPSQLAHFIEIMLDKGCDAVIGSKRHPQSRVQYPWLRRFYSATYYTIVRVLFGLPLRDTQTGLKLFKRDILRHVFPRMFVKRFAFDIELLVIAHRLKYKIAEAPVHLEFQRLTNRIRFCDVLDVAWDTLAIFYRMHITRDYHKPRSVDIADLPQPHGTREVAVASAHNR